MATQPTVQAPPQPLARQRRIRFTPQTIVPYALLIALVIILILLQPNLFKISWVERKTDSTMTLIFVVIGQTMVILTGGIDLSVGGVMSFTNSLAATHFGNGGPEMIVWIVIILGIGIGAGLLNGCIIAKLHVQPFIATLATWSIWGGLALSVLPTDGGSVPDSLYKAATGTIFGVPKSILLLIVLIVGWLIFKRTRLATQIYALGSSEKSAYLSGSNVVRVKITAYVMSGFFAALAGIYRTIQNTSGSPTAGNPFILSSIAAVVIGGTSLAGGRGGVLGGIAGAFILALIADVIFFAGVSSYFSSIFQGLLLIGAVTLYSVADYWQRRRRNA
jgi:ribose transport system permease protein